MLQTNVPPSSLTANPKSEGDGMVSLGIWAPILPPPTTDGFGASPAPATDTQVSTITAQSADNTQRGFNGEFNAMVTPLEDAVFRCRVPGVSWPCRRRRLLC